ncbi:MAG: 3-carboxy-cis,cis-muconate cycloisomerase [Reyranellaceae bacterium]
MAMKSDLPLAALFGETQSTPELLAVFSATGTVQAMLDVEAALARAEAARGIVPKNAARAIERACSAESYDVASLAKAMRKAGNLAIPLVAALTDQVATGNAAASRYVHWGATSQDITDTATALQLRAAAALIAKDLNRLRRGLAKLARRHRRTVMTGRTLMQAAAPTSFGLKVASWLDALDRHDERLRKAQARCLVLQFGGAAGTLAALGRNGPAVARALGRDLKLPVPAIPWHAERDRIGEFAGVFGLLTGTLGKIARDISLSMQSEIGEAREPGSAGRGGSSTLPHKRNPIACASVLAAALRAPGLVATILSAQVQEHERALGGWQAEWSVLPELVMLAGGAVRHMAETIEGLEVDRERMRQNLEARNGLVMAEAVAMALAEKTGKSKAHHLIERASGRAVANGMHLRQVIEQDPEIARHFDRVTLDRVFDPRRNLGSADSMIDAVLRASRSRA